MLEIARRHPEYGYRRTNAELRDRGIQVNRKVVARLHTSWDLRDKTFLFRGEVFSLPFSSESLPPFTKK